VEGGVEPFMLIKRSIGGNQYTGGSKVAFERLARFAFGSERSTQKVILLVNS